MEDELNLDLDVIENNADNNLQVKNRFQKLANNVKLEAQAKDEALALAKTNEERALNAEKETTFYKDFSANVSKYPQASEYQDQILEKVKAGYTTEDAMVAVLAKEGKLSQASGTTYQPIVESNVAGGSASTVLEGTKSIKDMSRDEKFAELQRLEGSEDLMQVLKGLG